MNWYFRRFMGCLAVVVLVSACETDGGDDPATVMEEADMEPGKGAVGDFLRTAAITSQGSYNYPAAVNYYQSLYSRDPNNMEALLGLAQNLRYIGSAPQAVTMLREAMLQEAWADDAVLRAELGKVLVASGQTSEAIASLSETSLMIPDDWEVFSVLGIAYDLNGDSENAHISYRKALAISPNNISVINNLALSLALSGAIDAGIDLLVKAASLPDAVVHIRQNLALMYAMKGDLDRAQALAERDLPPEMVEHNVAFYQQLGATGSGDQAAAIQDMGVTAAPVPTVDVTRLEAPSEAPAPVQEIAVGPATTSPDDGEPSTIASASLPADSIRIELGVYSSRERATAGLTALRDGHVDLLSGLQFEISDVEDAGSDANFVVMAGPLASTAMAADLCTKLHSRQEECRLIIP
jgi:Flp pilus assembly protein TadD